ncbi:UvrD-helicase domain-containing protein [Solwaraspora sp. WMMD1047]|uniref:UvrD-helicase domain-containing protein n=1 Tax=Solwaraspora sp. WMMD1047 TaxID=3016102 RepID=UPI002416B10D|nr:UvrD-helicase domain-containing protein [Solwaraspora sp. WMMD1047]MDG4832394.1 UvrD-helicase domain-containing protein [Solwaraspora sp. WMMD1047]
MSHKPTHEQQQIIDAARTGDDLTIEAGAGTGKTSTLKMLARDQSRRRGAYLAYNKAIAVDAAKSFPSSVVCKTAHSFAYGAVGRDYAHRLKAPRMPAGEAAGILGINEPVKVGEVTFSYQQLARLVTETIQRFCYSADDRIQRMNVPLINGVDKAGQAELARYLVPIAQRAWDEDITSREGRLRFTHDCYLKMWILSKPVIHADYVLLDEAQDSNPAVAGLVSDQPAQRILVGDRSQAIYGWRGATDAMATFDGQRFQLSQSFRFGPAVAAEANKWLSLLDAPLRLTGYDAIPSRIGALGDAADAVLCRSNGGAIGQVMSALGAGRRVALVGGGNEIRRMAEAAERLQAGRPTDHPELFAFTSWREVRDYVEHDAAGSDLRVFVRLIDKHGAREVMRVCDALVDERCADVVVSTAHKAKGREWPTVRIAADFPEPKPDSDTGETPSPAREEAMLAYVAVTRAQDVLDREGLAWVDRHVVGAARVHDPAAIMPDAPDDTAPDIGDLIEASSLGTPEAKALREEARSVLAGELTGMPEEQADWDADQAPEPLVDTAYGPLPAHEAAQLAEHGYVTCRCLPEPVAAGRG